MDADGGKSVRVDLRDTHLYEVVDQRNQPLRKVTGAEIKEAGKWAIQLKSHKNLKSRYLKREVFDSGTTARTYP